MRKEINKRLLTMLVATVVAANTMIMPNVLVNADNVESAENQSKVLTSSEISVFRYQVKMSTETVSVDSVAYRTVCKAPKAGEKITVEGSTYTVKDVGVIYTLDDNRTGKADKTVLDDSYTILDETTRTGSGSNEYYVGKKMYNGTVRTYGYVASDNGIVPAFAERDTEETNRDRYCYYVRTMGDMDALVANTIIARGFVVCTDGTIIYGETVQKRSIAELAHYLYTNGQIGNETSFNYIFEAILNSEVLRKCNEKFGNRYYVSEPDQFGWSPIVRPWET